MSEEEIPKWKQIDAKMMSGMSSIGKLMREARFTKGDLKKFFVMAVDEKSGKVMTSEEMYALEVDEIGGWCRIGEFDVDLPQLSDAEKEAIASLN